MEIDVAPRVDKVRKARKLAALARLATTNRFSRSAITGDAPVALSITSYGKRMHGVAYAIESIGAGTVRPERFILWVDEPDFALADFPMLERLTYRGLEIRRTENFGPHKKSYPYCREHGGSGLDLVTADDDVLYPSGWLAGLAQARMSYPGEFLGYRGKIVTTDSGGLVPYAQWPLAHAGDAGSRVFLTGLAGIVFPARLRAAIRDAGEEFMDVCPRADDIWINVHALRSGTPTRILDAGGMSLLSMPRSQGDLALHTENVARGGNDRQLAATMTPADLRAWAGSSGE